LAFPLCASGKATLLAESGRGDLRSRVGRGREEAPVQLSRLIDAHQIIIAEAERPGRRASELGDDGTYDLGISKILRPNELQTWFLSEPLVNNHLVVANDAVAT